MAQVKEKVKAQTEVPQPLPPESAITIMPPKAEGESGSFKKQLESREDEYRTLLPGHIPPERFMAVAQTAVKKNPKLLDCTPRSLFLALSQAAQDGLMPDGREGIIQGYNTKVEETGQPTRWEMVATWIPMTFGIRKRARETDQLIIDAQIVCANDTFDRDQGDDPKIIHKPAPLDKEPGDMIGAYAIFKYEDGNIIHRETMRKTEIEAVRAKSKSPNGMLWKDFPGEAWRKTAIRRGSKTVPVSPDLERIIHRDDQNFDFSEANRQDAPALNPPSPPTPPSAPAPQPPAPPQPHASAAKADNDTIYTDWRRDLYSELDSCESDAAVEDLRDRALSDLKDEDKQAWKEACADKATALFKAKK